MVRHDPDFLHMHAVATRDLGERAFKKVLDIELPSFEQEFYKWTEKQIATWGYDEETTKKVDELKEKGEELIESKQYDEALKVWQQVAKLRPMDQTPHMRLAVLEVKANNPTEAVKHLEALHAVELHDNIEMVRTGKRLATVSKLGIDFQAIKANRA